MCGIVALDLREPVPWARTVLSEMLAAQRHRGPDNTGTHVDGAGRVLLGHNRLSIVDLSPSGNQPMPNEDGTLWVVVNGEIYNSPSLRRELESRGHTFRSRSDSEVILHLYEEMGTDLVDRLHGMFAFVLYDERTEQLFCARDRVGKKPLVYGVSDHGVVVASELPATLKMPHLDRSIDEQALALYFLRNLRHVPDPLTLYRGARRLPPGHAMVVSQGSVQRVWRYWKPHFRTRPVEPGEVRTVFDRAVELRLLADTEIAALLSGGVDSTAIVDAMARHGAKDTRTYALGRDRHDEELERARRAASMLGTNHREFYFDPARHYDSLRHLLRCYGEPIALLPLAWAHELCRQVSDDGVKVVMAGHGADEVFFGYTGFVKLALVSRVLGRLPKSAGALAGALAARLRAGSPAREAALLASEPPGRRKLRLYLDQAELVWPELLVLKEGGDAARAALEETFATWMSDGPPEDYIDEAAAIGLMHENAHSVTIAGDLPAMAASVETRAPFLDQDLVQLAWQIPFSEKVGSIRDSTQLKLILKRSLADRLPQEILYAQKRGFGYNIQESDVLAGPWSKEVSTALDELGDLGGMLDGSAVARIRREFDEHRDSRRATVISKLHALSLALN